MKCICGYEFLKDWQTEDNKQVGDEEFIKLDCFGKPFETSEERQVDWGPRGYRNAYLYGCPKCHTVQFDFD